MEVTNSEWASAIALRIVDESDIINNSLDDAELLRSVIQELLEKNDWAVKMLIGTTIIEEDYFSELT